MSKFVARAAVAACVLACTLISAVAVAQDAIPNTLPNVAAARAAFARFAADPVHRLDSTAPFLEFIRSGGDVHIVLNEALLGWMYDDIEPHNKAVLYAAYLGGNMDSQLQRGEMGSDDVAGMTSALRAYQAIRSEQSAFTLPLFERLADAADAGTLRATIEQLSGSDEQPQ